MSDNEIPNFPSQSDTKRVKARLAELISQRAKILGMGQNALVWATGLNISDLPGLMDGDDSETTIGHLREALAILTSSDSGRELTSRGAYVFGDNPENHPTEPQNGETSKNEQTGTNSYKGRNESQSIDNEKLWQAWNIEKGASIFGKEIGRRVAVRRKELGLTQSELAERAGLTRSLIAQVETARGEINAGEVPQLCHVLQVPITYLFEGMGEPPETGTEGGSVFTFAEQVLIARFRLLKLRDKTLVLNLAEGLRHGTLPKMTERVKTMTEFEIILRDEAGAE